MPKIVILSFIYYTKQFVFKVLDKSFHCLFVFLRMQLSLAVFYLTSLLYLHNHLRRTQRAMLLNVQVRQFQVRRDTKSEEKNPQSFVNTATTTIKSLTSSPLENFLHQLAREFSSWWRKCEENAKHEKCFHFRLQWKKLFYPLLLCSKLLIECSLFRISYDEQLTQLNRKNINSPNELKIFNFSAISLSLSKMQCTTNSIEFYFDLFIISLSALTCNFYFCSKFLYFCMIQWKIKIKNF